ncbi:hypothetical protein D3869_16915 (plasmid) [Azospirillum brasilense]|uniref:Uncharacterized protein n=1 Tax=Azospirillum brasilense TaxID=192 RepID=A0A4D8R866_AZOBR|nr:hypothetical protein [Azospirillum brasilense]QCO16973.1 hypothetical protein D3869_16915 [Azospirillum brasilense]
MALARKKTKGNLLLDDYCLAGTPFRVADIYNPDSPGVYVREMYGPQLAEFHRKFFLLPLDREQRQTIGAVWSSHTGDSEGRGFGKSMLMCEESRLVNRDFGAALLASFDIEEEDIAANPFIAGYCGFAENMNIKTFPAALLEGVVFALRCDHGGHNVHRELRRRAAAQLGAEAPYEAEAIKKALVQALSGYKNLPIQLTQRQVAGFLDALCHDDTEALADYVRERIGPRIKASLGFHFVHIFNAFAKIAGIVHVVFFVDQVENFAKWARHQGRDVRILRESMCQTSPTADMASFVFQMHMNAQRELEPIWHAEHLPSLDYAVALNQPRVVDLKGLSTANHARRLTADLLAAKRPAGRTPPTPLHPFNEDVVEFVRRGVDGNPRRFLETLNTILTQAELEGEKTIDLTFVQPFIDVEAGQFRITEDQEDDDVSNPVQ